MEKATLDFANEIQKRIKSLNSIINDINSQKLSRTKFVNQNG